MCVCVRACANAHEYLMDAVLNELQMQTKAVVKLSVIYVFENNLFPKNIWMPILNSLKVKKRIDLELITSV